jgi:shikimate kinase
MVQENRSFSRRQGAPFPDRIILTGFRATGKSAVGARLAESMGFDFIDTDARLCAGLGCTVAEYVAGKGWDAFREREREILAELAGVTRTVISTGGGSILHEAEWNRLRKNSLVVWLRADAETLRQRLNRDESTADQRPSLTGSDSSREVEDVLAVRTPLYLKGSDMSVDTTALTPEEIVNMIEKEIFSEFSMEG